MFLIKKGCLSSHFRNMQDFLFGFTVQTSLLWSTAETDLTIFPRIVFGCKVGAMDIVKYI